MTKMIKVLIIDDEVDDILKAPAFKEAKGFKFFAIEQFDCEKILETIKKNPDISVLLLDIVCKKHEKKAGIRVFHELDAQEEWQKYKGTKQIVFFSSTQSVQNEYNATKEKRCDLSGFRDKAHFLNGYADAFNALRSAHANAKRCQECPSYADPILKQCEILYSSNTHSMRRVVEKIYHASACHEPVLIQGETGTGKELVAKAIFKFMQKNPEEIKGCDGDKPLAYNIGSAPTYGNVQYTELFGAKNNAVPGLNKKKGLFVNATEVGKNGRTIFLDEIGDADPIIQVALLRVLQEREIIPLGAFDDADPGKKVNFRLISASHVNLAEDIERGDFREDLYYRLNTIEIKVPPLRERKDDIPILAYHFLQMINKEYGTEKTIAEKAQKQLYDTLKAYDWPGNVRQLESLIRRSYVMNPGEEFRLCRDTLAVLNGSQNKKGVKSPGGQDPKTVLEQLARQGMPLKKLSDKYGKLFVLELLEYYWQKNRQNPDKLDSQNLFCSKPDNVRKYKSELIKAKKEGRI